MIIGKMDIRWKYVINAYLLFWVMIMGLGGIATVVFNAPPIVMTGVTILCSWSPTIVLLGMLKELQPGMTVRGFYQKAFAKKISIKVLAVSWISIIGVFMISVGLAAYIGHTPFTEQVVFMPQSLVISIIITALQGPSGEESGWRGYLLDEMIQKYGFKRGNVILGLVWAFWHMPLWFLSSGYSGIELLIYSLSVVICLVGFATMIGVCLKRCHNLFVAFWMHFWFNFSLTFFRGQIWFFVILAFIYALMAIVFVEIDVKMSKR